jgi:hypothetical protein
MNGAFDTPIVCIIRLRHDKKGKVRAEDNAQDKDPYPSYRFSISTVQYLF